MALLLVSGATLLVGLLLGFLFGIPRTVQLNEGAMNHAQRPGDNADQHHRALSYELSTNLEQISDWLTKILIGVGLTQLSQIGSILSNIATEVLQGFEKSNGAPPDGARPLIEASVVYFAVAGVLSGYLWTRLEYTRLLMTSDAKSMSEANRIDLIDIELRTMRTATTIGVGKKREASKEILPEWAHQWLQDNPQLREASDDEPDKGRFGGKAEINGRRLSAQVTQFGVTDSFTIAVRVDSTDASRPLSGQVVFILHPTFDISEDVIDVEDGKAEDSLTSLGAFTLGALADEGETALELDLAKLPGAPKAFKER